MEDLKLIKLDEYNNLFEEIGSNIVDLDNKTFGVTNISYSFIEEYYNIKVSDDIKNFIEEILLKLGDSSIIENYNNKHKSYTRFYDKYIIEKLSLNKIDYNKLSFKLIVDNNLNFLKMNNYPFISKGINIINNLYNWYNTEGCLEYDYPMLYSTMNKSYEEDIHLTIIIQLDPLIFNFTIKNNIIECNIGNNNEVTVQEYFDIEKLIKINKHFIYNYI